MAWELTRSQSDQKPLESDEKLTVERVRHIDRTVEKNCKEGLETSHARLPGKALRINVEANFSRVHATLQPALSVGRLVGHTLLFYDFISLTSLLLPKWSGDLK